MEVGKVTRFYGAKTLLLKMNFFPLFLERRLFSSFRTEERIKIYNAREKKVRLRINPNGSTEPGGFILSHCRAKFFVWNSKKTCSTNVFNSG